MIFPAAIRTAIPGPSPDPCGTTCSAGRARPGERSTHMGSEATLAGTASLRIGRSREGYWRGYRGEGTAYTWGYGISFGPWLGPRVMLGYDFARFFRTVSVRPMTPGTLHQKALQLRLSW